MGGERQKEVLEFRITILQELNEGRRSPRSDAQIIKVVFVASENFSTLPSQKCNPTR